MMEAMDLATSMQDVLPLFRQALAAGFGSLEREGDVVPTPGAQIVTADREGLSLAAVIAIDGLPIVKAAGHQGGTSPAMRAAADRLCAIIEGLPLQEAAEHGVLRLIETLRDPAEPPHVPGIATVKSCGAIFVLLQQLIRDLYARYLSESGEQRRWNAWNPRLPSEWLRLSKEQQAAKLKPIIVEHLSAERLTPDDMWISDIERDVRIIMSFGPRIISEQKPQLLMRLERRLRDEAGMRLELYAEEMSDKNVIRRL